MKYLKKDFPIFKKKINGKSLIYFDNAATSQKPQQVIDSMVNFYSNYNAPVHKAVYTLAEQATELFENARQNIAQFIGVQDKSEIIFTKGVTDSINSIAHSWLVNNCKAGDEIVLSQLEHHSNMVPWQEVAKKMGLKIKYISVNDNGILDYAHFKKIITSKTKLVSIVHTSNFLGTHFDVESIIKDAHLVGAKVFVDGAQSTPNQKIDVKKMDCDFFTFSGHKMFGPTGIGVLYVKKKLQDNIKPFQFGGGMVFNVNYDSATWNQAPYKFEAGTPAIAEVIGLSSAVDYYNNYINFDDLKKHQANLCTQLINGLAKIKNIKILGSIEQLKKQGHLVSFFVKDVHAHDVAHFLNQSGICVRAGHHCVQPFVNKLGVDASIRASFSVYNCKEEVDFFLKIINNIVK